MTDLLAQYREFHAQNPKLCVGYSVVPHVEAIARLVERTGAETLLDYGCGKGWQYLKKQVHAQWRGILPALYDPGVLGLWFKPHGTFDGVICTDVMEHVAEESVPAVLDEIMGYAEKFVFLSICTRPAKREKVLPDGTPMHVTVRSEEWWDPHVASALDRAEKRLTVKVAYTE